MHILFICKYNGARSQMAEALFRAMCQEHTVASAGTHADAKPGEPLQTLAIQAMQTIGLDLSQHFRKQLTPAMIETADKIVVLNKPDDCPEFVTSSKKALFAYVPEADGRGYGFYCERREQIKQLVEKLIKEYE